MKKSISSLALILAVTTNANAGDYTVQVGAYKSLTDQTIEQAQSYGEVFQRTGNDNLERLSIGRFSNRSDANNMRDTLRASGFSGAFITVLDSNSLSASTGNYTTSNYTNSYSENTASNYAQSTTQSTVIKSNSTYSIEDLNADERVKASYLDGQLRILSEGNFYTVEQYRQQNRY